MIRTAYRGGPSVGRPEREKGSGMVRYLRMVSALLARVRAAVVRNEHVRWALGLRGVRWALAAVAFAVPVIGLAGAAGALTTPPYATATLSKATTTTQKSVLGDIGIILVAVIVIFALMVGIHVLIGLVRKVTGK